MKLLAIRAVMRLFSWITPRAAKYIAPPLAAIVWYSVPRLRRVTRMNLKAAYPEMDAKQRKKIGRASMTHYVKGIFEAGMLWHWPLDRLYGLFDEVQGMEEVDELISLGKGLIVAAPHYGSWEMLNLYLHSKGEAAILYKPSKHPDIDALLTQKRARAGAEMVAATGKGLRRMYQLLKEGYFVALLPDQEPTGGGGQFAPFFGVEALTGVLLPRMAQRTGAPVVFAICERRKGGRYCVHLFTTDPSIYSEDMREALTEVNRRIEQCIEVDREQYLWAYKRFRNRPEGEKSFYKR
ncbi:MAG: lysophospholipid acyltransferase family protein [Xanthomonadales bacterium]|nr:lysophospholipid acyltransferase family protein [Xanthomonadales bacterium]